MDVLSTKKYYMNLAVSSIVPKTLRNGSYRHGGTEIPYLDSECPTFSQYIEQMRILVTFMEQPEAKDKPIIHLADKLSASDTCGWSKNKDL